MLKMFPCGGIKNNNVSLAYVAVNLRRQLSVIYSLVLYLSFTGIVSLGKEIS